MTDSITSAEPVPKPPLCIEPEYIWLQKRIDDICAAVTRYREANYAVPRHWYVELGQLCNKYCSITYCNLPEQKEQQPMDAGLGNMFNKLI